MSREMKDSGVAWIGEIPRDWGLEAIKRNYTIYNGSTPKSDKKEYWDGDITWITPIDMYGNVYVNRSKKTITEIGLNSCGTTLVPINSVILSTRAPIGQVCLSMVELCTNQGCKSLVPDKRSYSKYLMYYLMIQTNVLNMLGRGTTFLELSTNSLVSFIMPVPPPTEQQSIANYLDEKCAEIDKLISLLEEMIGELKAYKQSVITEAVCKGLNKNVPMKDSGIEWIGEIPKDWRVAKMKNLLIGIQDGTHGTFTRVVSGYPLLSAKNVLDNGIIVSNNESSISEEDYQTIVSNGFPQKGDILLCCVGTIGRCCIFEENHSIAFQRSVSFLRTNMNNYNRYVMYSIKSSYVLNQLIQYSNSSAQSGIYLGILKNIKILFPSLSEQQTIANYLDEKCGNIEGLIAIKQAKIDELKEFKKSLIYEYVTGKKSVI